MPKWVRKAQSLGISPEELRRENAETALKDIVSESRRAISDLQFVIDHTSFDAQLTLDVDGLNLAETFCRDTTAWQERKESFPDEQVERLVALFVGQVFAHHQRGNWVVYPGKYHAPHPVVIELTGQPGKHIHPFLYCTDMRTNMEIIGARYNKTLQKLFENPGSFATK